MDDDEAIVDSLKEILQLQGYSVDTAYSGSQALRKSESKDYHLALFDIKLPDMEGTELLTRIHKEMPKMMKIMITGFPALDNAVESLNLGADAYLMKPVSPEELLRVVAAKLKEQDDIEKMNQKKIKEWIENRVRKIRNAR